jgi:hypothetical protein
MLFAINGVDTKLLEIERPARASGGSNAGGRSDEVLWLRNLIPCVSPFSDKSSQRHGSGRFH